MAESMRLISVRTARRGNGRHLLPGRGSGPHDFLKSPIRCAWGLVRLHFPGHVNEAARFLGVIGFGRRFYWRRFAGWHRSPFMNGDILLTLPRWRDSLVRNFRGLCTLKYNPSRRILERAKMGKWHIRRLRSRDSVACLSH
jgi:hypothetical protein